MYYAYHHHHHHHHHAKLPTCTKEDEENGHFDSDYILYRSMVKIIIVWSMLAGCYHKRSDEHHVGLFQIGEANLEKKCCLFIKNILFARSRSSHTKSSTWYKDITSYIICGHDPQNPEPRSRSSYAKSSTWYKDITSYIICGHDPQNWKKDNGQKCGDRKRGSLHIT